VTKIAHDATPLVLSEGARHAARAEVYAALPTGWVVTPPVYDPHIQMWRVSARDLRGAPREHQPWEEAVGAHEATALRVLAAARQRGRDSVTDAAAISQ
jgi:hypothetical protein